MAASKNPDNDVLEVLKKFGEDLESVKKMVQRGILQQPLETPRTKPAKKQPPPHATGRQPSGSVASRRSSTHHDDVWTRLTASQRLAGKRSSANGSFHADSSAHGTTFADALPSHAVKAKRLGSGAHRTTSPPTTDRSLLAVPSVGRLGRDKKKSASPSLQRRGYGVDFSQSSQHHDAAARQNTHTNRMKRSMSAEVRQRHGKSTYATPNSYYAATNGDHGDRRAASEATAHHHHLPASGAAAHAPQPASLAPSAAPAISPSLSPTRTTRSERSEAPPAGSASVKTAASAPPLMHPHIVAVEVSLAELPTSTLDDVKCKPTPPPRLREATDAGKPKPATPVRDAPDGDGSGDTKDRPAKPSPALQRNSSEPALRNERAGRTNSSPPGDKAPSRESGGSDASAAAANGAASPDVTRVNSHVSHASTFSSSPPQAPVPKNPHLSKIPKLSLGVVIEKKQRDPSFTYEKFLTLTTGEEDVRACPVVSVPAMKKPGDAGKTAPVTVNLGDSNAPQAKVEDAPVNDTSAASSNGAVPSPAKPPPSPPRPVFAPPPNVPKNPHLSKIPKLSLGGVIEKKQRDPSFTYEKFLTLTTGEEDVRACPVVSVPAMKGGVTTVNLGDSTAPQAKTDEVKTSEAF